MAARYYSPRHGPTLTGPPPHCDPCAPCREGGRAKLRVVNGIINGPKDGYDVSVEGITPFQGVLYQGLTQYVWVNAGLAKFTVRKSGMNETILWPKMVLGENNPYTLLLIGDVKDPEFRPQLKLIRDHNNTPEQSAQYPNVGYSKVRFFHASPRSPPVDMLKGGTCIFSGVEYGSVDCRPRHDYQRFPAVNRQMNHAYQHQLSLVQHQNAKDAKPVVLTAPTSVAFECDKVYTIWAFGKYNDAANPLQLIITTDWPEAAPDPCDDEDLTETERRIRDGLRQEIQSSDSGIYAKKPEKQGDGVNGFGFAGIPIGKQIGVPTEPGVSFAHEEGKFQETALVRMIHSLGKIGASLSIEDEPVVKNLAHGRVTEPLALHPGKYNVKMFAGSNMIGEKMVNFQPGSIYTMTAHSGDEMAVHVDTPDTSMCHMKVLSLSKNHGMLSNTQSFEEPSIQPVNLFARKKGSEALVPLMGPRPVRVPEQSHVTVFLLDDADNNIAASIQTCDL